MELLCRQQNCTESSMCISWDSVYEKCQTQTLVFDVLLFQQYSKFITNIASKNVHQACTKNARPHPPIAN